MKKLAVLSTKWKRVALQKNRMSVLLSAFRTKGAHICLLTLIRPLSSNSSRDTEHKKHGVCLSSKLISSGLLFTEKLCSATVNEKENTKRKTVIAVR